VRCRTTILLSYLFRDHSLRLDKTLRDSFEHLLEVATAVGRYTLVFALGEGEDVGRDCAGFLPYCYVEEGTGAVLVVSIFDAVMWAGSSFWEQVARHNSGIVDFMETTKMTYPCTRRH